MNEDPDCQIIAPETESIFRTTVDEVIYENSQ